MAFVVPLFPSVTVTSLIEINGASNARSSSVSAKCQVSVRSLRRRGRRVAVSEPERRLSQFLRRMRTPRVVNRMNEPNGNQPRGPLCNNVGSWPASGRTEVFSQKGFHRLATGDESRRVMLAFRKRVARHTSLLFDLQMSQRGGGCRALTNPYSGRWPTAVIPFFRSLSGIGDFGIQKSVITAVGFRRSAFGRAEDSPTWWITPSKPCVPIGQTQRT